MLNNQYEKYSQSLLSLVKNKSLYSGDSQNAFRGITEAATACLSVERASIWLYSKDSSSMTLVDLYQNSCKLHSAGISLSESDYPEYFRALAKERVIDASDAHKDPRTFEFSVGYLDVLGIGALLDAPINFAGDVIGVICLEHTGGQRVWSVEEITYASSLADLTAHALEAEKRANAETALERREEQFSTLLETIPDIVYENDSNGVLTYVSSAFEETTGYSPDEALGNVFVDGLIVDEVMHEKLYQKMISQGYLKNDIIQMRKKDGSYWWASVSAKLIKDLQGNVVRSNGIIRDITAEKITQERLSYQASHDSLTDLINRTEFERRISVLLDEVKVDGDGESHHAMCFLDIDQFKVINDSYGHIAGDQLICNLGELLKNTIRKSDTLARLGGDEFGVLLKQCSLHQAQLLANKILDTVAHYQFHWKGKPYKVSVSVGIVAITTQSADFIDLFRQADAACYMAKEAGRNRVHTYYPDDIEATNRRTEMSMVSRINQALDEDRFCLYAQKIVPLNEEDSGHVELLVRMVDEDGKIIAPGAFLPAAERYNLIEKLDLWVVKNACRFISKNARQLESIGLFTINLSGPSLSSDLFYNTVIEIFDKTGIQPTKVCFEVTETVAVSNLNSAKNFIASLKLLGFRFALDDFGSGISSFGYLKNLPVDYLKIDGMFVKDMADDAIDYAMVKSINEIGHVMGMKTIAEFVENDAIVEKLKVLGVNYGQGYGLGKPMPLEHLINKT